MAAFLQLVLLTPRHLVMDNRDKDAAPAPQLGLGSPFAAPQMQPIPTDRLRVHQPADEIYRALPPQYFSPPQ